jgi:hypothetical protein
MKLHELKHIIDGISYSHGGDLEVVFKYRFASGKTSEGVVTKYEISPPKKPMRGVVRFTIDHARGEPTNV